MPTLRSICTWPSFMDSGRRDWIKSVAPERMAAADPPQREPAPTKRAVPLERLGRIRRTRRHEPARRRRPGRDSPLVESNHPDQSLLQHHASTAVISSSSNTECFTPYAPGRARSKRSVGPASASSTRSPLRRPISLSLRFTRFRSTISWPCFGTITPSRENKTGEAAKKTSKCFVLSRFPRSRRARISDPSRIRALLGNASARTRPADPTCLRSERPAANGRACDGG